jgi:hypothetical protein
MFPPNSPFGLDNAPVAAGSKVFLQLSLKSPQNRENRPKTTTIPPKTVSHLLNLN